jgi:hypothetical protein
MKVMNAWWVSTALTLVSLGAACVTTRMSPAPSNAEPDAESTSGSGCVIVQCNASNGQCTDSANIPDGPGSLAPCPSAGSHRCYTLSTTNPIDCVWSEGQTTMMCSCAQGASRGGSFDVPRSSAPDEALIAALWTQHCQGTCGTPTNDNDAGAPPHVGDDASPADGSAD